MCTFKYYILNPLWHKSICRLSQILNSRIILELYYYQILLSLYLGWVLKKGSTWKGSSFSKISFSFKERVMVIFLARASNGFSFCVTFILTNLKMASTIFTYSPLCFKRFLKNTSHILRTLIVPRKSFSHR